MKNCRLKAKQRLMSKPWCYRHWQSDLLKDTVIFKCLESELELQLELRRMEMEDAKRQRQFELS